LCHHANDHQAAKLKDCSTIIAVDLVEEKLELAKKLGATHIINSSKPGIDIVEEVKRITDGIGTSIVVETTGNVRVIKSCVEATAFRGQLIIVGVPPADAELNANLMLLMQSGKQLRGCIEGDSVPSTVSRC
jgi:Zn-dependent alcohol dehydrogenase